MATAPELSRSEWQAVSIAFNDAARCGCAGAEPGPVARLLAKLTGNDQLRPLADPRLETLRRFVCTTRAKRRPADALVPALIDQGFNRAQVDALALLAA